MSAKHTAGPWVANSLGGIWGVETAHEGQESSGHICTLEDLGDDTEATARFIAAAPDVAEAGRLALLALEHHGISGDPVNALRAALKKAGVL